MKSDTPPMATADGLAVHHIALTRPRTFGGVRYTALDMTEPHVKARMQVNDADLPGVKEIEIALVAILCGVPTGLIERLSLVDYQKVQATLANFPYPEEPASGRASSASPA